MQHIDSTVRLFHGSNSQPIASTPQVIRDVTQKMGDGMADNVRLDMGQGTAVSQIAIRLQLDCNQIDCNTTLAAGEPRYGARHCGSGGLQLVLPLRRWPGR